jgi:hypothetical protein
LEDRDGNVGLLLRKESWWIGIHWSPYNRRFCINIFPMLTLWIAFDDGKVPRQGFDIFRTDATQKNKPCRWDYLHRLAQHYPHEL